MSDMHVLTGNEKRRWTVIMHFPVPDINNAVGVNYRTALVSSRTSIDPISGLPVVALTTMVEGSGPGQITTAEKATVEAGELFEHSVPFLVESGGTSPSELRDALRAEYAKQETATIERVKLELKYFGHTEDAV